MARSNFSTSNYLDVGSGSTLDNMSAGTLLAWVYLTAISPTGTLHAKGSAGARNRLQFTASGGSRYQAEIGRATTTYILSAEDENLVGSITNNMWHMVAWTWDLSLTNGDQRLFTGSRTVACGEPSSYTTQDVGSGAKGDDAAADMVLGLFNLSSGPWQGALGCVQILSRQITLAEARSWQFYPRYLPGTVGLWVPGWDDGTTVPDLSGNGTLGRWLAAPRARPTCRSISRSRCLATRTMMRANRGTYRGPHPLRPAACSLIDAAVLLLPISLCSVTSEATNA